MMVKYIVPNIGESSLQAVFVGREFFHFHVCQWPDLRPAAGRTFAQVNNTSGASALAAVVRGDLFFDPGRQPMGRPDWDPIAMRLRRERRGRYGREGTNFPS